MCDPISIGLGVAAAGVGTSVYGQVKQSQAQKKAGAQQKAAYDKQQEAYNAAADNRMKKLAVDLETTATDFVRKRGSNAAAIGASGISQSSFYDVLADSHYEYEFTKSNLKYSAQLDAAELRKSGQIAGASGRAAQASANDAATGSLINAGATALSGASSIYLQGVKLSQPFATTTGWEATTYNAAGNVI